MKTLCGLALLLGLAGCDNELQPMKIVPIQYAPVQVISGSSAANTATSALPREIPDPVGCWEQTPAVDGQPLIRRWYASLPTLASYEYVSAEVSRDEPPTSRVLEQYTVHAGRDLINLPYPVLRKEKYLRDDEAGTLTIDGRVFRRLPERESSRDDCLPQLKDAH